MSVEAKNAKQLIIDEIKAKFDKSISIVVVDYLGITVAQADELSPELSTKDSAKPRRDLAHSHTAKRMQHLQLDFSRRL